MTVSDFSTDGIPQPGEGLSPLKRSLLALRELRAKLEGLEQVKTEPVAIIGMGCRFPGGVDSPESFWEQLSRGESAISELPSGRWDRNAYYDPDPDSPGKMYTTRGGYIDAVDSFDPQFWGLSPRETIAMDPQQRLLLEVSWEALENAGQAPDRLAGSQTGVFIGISSSDYAWLEFWSGELTQVDTYMGTGSLLSVAAGRIAYLLGFQGPALSVDTACSSSLLALHLACQHLRSGKVDLALAGGVNLILSPLGTIYLAKSRALAPDGRCKTFDARADGFVRGEGCGVVVLKRLSDALAHGDSILAVVRGTAANHDGRSSGLTVPNGQAQKEVIEAALADTGSLSPDLVDYIEAHGTGTPLGDPIELRALADVFGKNHSVEHPLIVGSVKTNIGHLEAAAGVAALIKTVLSIQHGFIPPHLHFQTPTPHFEWKHNNLIVPTRLTPWQARDGHRVAGISSFGFSGTNAHVIVESPPEVNSEPGGVERPLQLLTLSAQNDAALMEVASNYRQHLAAHQDLSLTDATYTANTGRSHFKHRAAAIAASTPELLDKLDALAAGQEKIGVFQGQVMAAGNPKIAFLFTGQGSQYIGMGRELYNTQPLFHNIIDQCAELLNHQLERPLLSVLYPKVGEQSPLDDTAYTQPALFALEYALARLWQSWGITPAAIMGHSVGEYVAACLAGVFSLEDGLSLIAVRGQLMSTLPRNGAMVAVDADEGRVRAAISPYSQQVSIAALNGPGNIVISGLASSLLEVIQELEKEGIQTHRLKVSHAFHSPLMEPMLNSFTNTAASVRYTSPSIRLVSNVSGEVVKSNELENANYWRSHICQPVRFAQSIQAIQQLGCTIMLEVGPKPTLIGMAQHILPGDEFSWLSSLSDRRSDWDQILESLAKLYLQGVNVDWERFDQGLPRKRVSLPTYPFQRQRYWFQSSASAGRSDRVGLDGQSIHPLLGRRIISAAKEVQYECPVGPRTPSYLADRLVHGMQFLPESVYVELSLAAGRDYLKLSIVELDDLVVHQRIELQAEVLHNLQVILTPEGPDRLAARIFTLTTGEEKAESGWELLAECHLMGNVPQLPTAHCDIEEMKARFQPYELDAWQDELKQAGFEYGPRFLCFDQIWQGEGQHPGQNWVSRRPE